MKTHVLTSILGATLVLLGAAVAFAAPAKGKKPGKVRVLLWSEQTEPRDVYPTGISGALADHLNQHKEFEAKTAKLDDPDAGVGEAALAETDVLVWFGHKKHGAVPDDAVERVVKHIRERGMGFVGLHSTHFAKPLKKALNDTGAWSSYKNFGQPEQMWVVLPKHPIAKGLKDFTIPKEEIYTEPFEVPEPEAVIVEGTWPSGHRNRECMVWTLDKGRFVYIRAGHEDYPIYFMPEMQTLVRNGVLWAAKKTNAPKKLARREAGPPATATGPAKDPAKEAPKEAAAKPAAN
jgi:trehalose utilization protein